MAKKKDRKSFGSFQDLRRELGGGDADEAPEELPPESAADDQEVGEIPEDIRGLIDAAGDAFGPMARGPACYRDLGSEEMQLLASFRLRTVFPERVATQAQALPDDPSESDFVDRKDLRKERIFTIDGADAQDFDDAIQIKALSDGGHEVGVHIADVGHYVKPKTILDQEALARGTSVYLPDQVIPMLPENLSNQLCSLMPDRDRLAFSVIMTFNSDGERVDARLYKSVIRSRFRCTYAAVQALLDGEDDAEARRLAPIAEDLRLFERWTRKQQLLRDRSGSLRIQSPERKFDFDADHEVVRIYPSQLHFSQTLIEETALAANQAVGDFFKQRSLPTIYRIHPQKDPEEIEAVSKMLGEFGIRVPSKDRLTGRDVGRLIREARRRPNGEALIGRIMGLVERATYEVADHEDTAEHWGLAREHYLHFTSPIRRYPDLVVHRWLYDVLSRPESQRNEPLTEQQIADLTDIAGHCSVQADLAQMVETAVDDLKICQYMEPFEGETLRARVYRVSPAGIEVFLDEHYVSGFIPTRVLDGRTKMDGATLYLTSRRGNRAFTEGDQIDIKIKFVDFVRLQVLLDLA